MLERLTLVDGNRQARSKQAGIFRKVGFLLNCNNSRTIYIFFLFMKSTYITATIKSGNCRFLCLLKVTKIRNLPYTHVQSVKSLFALPTERAALNPLPSQRYASVN